MTPLQKRLYWREFGKVVMVCKASGNPVPDRHALHVRALGFDKSSKDMTNSEVDRVLAEFRAVSQPDNLDPQLDAQNQPRLRLEIGIRRGAPEPYWRKIAQDRFGSDDLASLSVIQLHQLRITIEARARARKRRASGTSPTQLIAQGGQ